MHESDQRAFVLRRFSRRRLLAGASGLAGAMALGRFTGAAQPTPTPTVPEDPTKVQGKPMTPVGSRSPFVALQRTFANNPTLTASWSQSCWR